MVNQEAENLKAKGNELFKEQKYAEAVKKYKNASSIDPTNVIYWSNMAFCYDKMRDLNAFKKAAQKCVDVNPTFIKGYYRLAKAQESVWEYDEAQETIKRGLLLDPSNTDLHGLLHRFNHQSHKLDTFQNDILDASTSNRFLGGLRDSDENKIPFDSAYGRLKRSPFPPMSKKHLDLSQYSKSVRPVFESFYNRKLKIQWYLDGTNFFLNGYIPTETVPVMSYIGQGGVVNYRYMYKSGLVTEQHQHYHRLLTTDQKKNLETVMIMRFLREKAALLNYDEFLSQLVKNISGECIERRMYKDACDIRLTYTDVCLNRGFDDAAISAVHLAEALESSKRYKDAGDIYVEISEAKVFMRHPGCPEARSRGFAGLAYKRAQDYISAEREYVGSLRAAGPTWNLSPSFDSFTNISNMMIFYEIAHRAVGQGIQVDDAHKKMQKACYILVGLLSIAGFNGKKAGCTLFKTSRLYQNLIKPKYKSSRKKALQAIVAATLKPSIDEYHKLLFSYQLDSCSLTTMVNPNVNLDEVKTHFVKDEKARAKSGSRDHTKFDQMLVFGVCINCNKHTEDIKECPCHTVKYCGKECQVAHWKTHGKICPLRKKR